MVRHSKLKRITAFLLVMLTCMGLFMIPASADEDTSADASFYKLSSVASGYLSTALSKPDADGWALPNVEPGDAGGLLGYSDNADESGLIEGWISSALSASSVTFSYDALRNIPVDDEGSTSTRNTYALWYYTQYGRLLNTVGFDSTSAETSMDFIRPAGGWLMKGAYYLASSVQSMFSIIVEFLHTLNPFRLFKSNTDPYTIDGLEYAADSATNPELKAIGDAITVWYDAIKAFAPIIIGVLFAIMLASILLTNKSFSEAKPKIKKFLIRAVSLVIGIPLLASLYTSMLGFMLPDGTTFGTADTPAEAAIFSVFLDFESWAQTNQLKMPSNAVMVGTTVWSGSGYGLVPTDETYKGLKATCLAINKASVGNLGTALDPSTTNPATSTKAASLVNNLLDRYTSGAFYYASSWEGYAKGKSLFVFESFKDTVEKTGTSVAVFKENSSALLDSGRLWPSNKAPGLYDVWTNGGSLVSDNSLSTLNYSTAGKLSTMSLYNYLTSTFGDSSVTVYSNEKASSGYVRQSHHSVNLIGTGILSFLYWLNAFALLISYAVLGWFYGMSVIFNAIKRLIHLIAAIPFAMLGSIRSIARVLIYSIMMILEVAITIFVYQIMCQLLASITGLIELPFIKAMTGNDAATGLGDIAGSIVLNGQPMALDMASILVVVLLFSTIVLVIFCIQALKIKKSIVKFIDEMITETIEKLFGVKSMGDGMSGPSAGARMAGAVGAGVGAGLAQKAMSGGHDKETQDTKGVQSTPPGGGSDAGTGLATTDGNISQDAQAGDAALDSGEQAALESGDVNIDDNDTATASFGDSDSEAQAEMAAADSMLALGDGSQTDGDVSQDVQAGDAAQGAITDNDSIAQEVEAGDESQALEDAGADSVADVGDQAQVAGEDAAEIASGDAANAGGVAAVAATGAIPDGHASAQAGQTKNGIKAGAAGNGQKIDPKTGLPTGQADQKAVGSEAKPAGITGNEAKPAAAINGSSNLQEAQQRNAAAKARLAALQGQSNQVAGQAQAGQTGVNGQKIDPKNQAKAISSDGATGGSQAAGQLTAGSVDSGTAPSTAQVGSQSQVTGVTAGQSSASMPAGAGVASPVTGVSAGAQRVDMASVPAGQPSTSGQSVANSAGNPGAIPAAAQSSAAAQGLASGGQAQTQAKQTMSRVASVNPTAQAMPVSAQGQTSSTGQSHRVSTAQPGQAMPVATPVSTQGGQSGRQGVSAPGVTSSPQAAGSVAQVARPSGAAQQSHVSVAQPGVTQAPVMSQPTQIISGGQVQTPVQNIQVPVQAGGKTVAQQQAAQQAQSGGGSSGSSGIAREQPAQVSGSKRGKSSKRSGQPTVAGAMAKAAVAAFMASSDSTLVSGVGRGAQSYQQMQMFSQMQRRGDDIAAPGADVESISAYDSDTAEIEAQIAKLEAQNRMRSAGGHKKLGGKASKPADDSGLL